MRIEGQYTFDGPRPILWELVRDPQVLATCLPGSPSVRNTGEHEYEGEIAIRVGPISGAFAASCRLRKRCRPPATR